MNYQQYLNTPTVQTFLLASFFIYLIFRLLHFFNRRFVLKQNHRKNLKKVIYFLEFVTWLLYVAESVKQFSEENLVVAVLLSIVLLIVISWTAWFVIKDYVIGLYLKWNDAFKINEVINVNGHTGKIIKLASRNAILEISPIHTLNISYSKLFTKEVVKTGLTDLSANVSFTLNVSKINYNTDHLNLIKTYILQLPWTNLKYSPTVLVENQGQDNVFVRISASLIDVNYTDQFRKSIKNRFE